jgi:hypothetical protein
MGKIAQGLINKISIGRVRKLVMILCLAGIAGCLLLLLPSMRSLIISFSEKYIVSRRLNVARWHRLFIQLAGDMLVIFGMLFGLTTGAFIKIMKKYHIVCNKQKFLYYITMALPIVFGFLVVTFFGVNVIYWDEWSVVSFLDHIIETGIHFPDFFVQSNEHRIAFPRIVFFIIGVITDLNVKSYMYISWACSSVLYITLLIYVKRTSGNRAQLHLMPGLLIGFSNFCLIQYENMLWGFQLAWSMIACLAVLSFYFFYLAYTKNANLYYILAVIAAIVASFSSLQGLLLLPTMLCTITLLMITNRRLMIKPLLFIIFPLLLTFFLYFIDYHVPDHHLPYYFETLSTRVAYFFTILGAAIVPRVFGNACVLGGLLVFIVSAIFLLYLIKTGEANNSLFPFCMLFFGYAFCVSVTMGRSGIGVSQAMSSRYTTFSLFIINGLILLTTGVVKNNRTTPFFLSVLFVLMFVQNVDSAFSAVQFVEYQKENKNILVNYKNQSFDSLKRICPWQDISSAYNAIQILEKHKWSVFAE